MFSSVKYIRGKKAYQMFVTEFGDFKVYPLKNKGDSHMDLSQYFKEVGVHISLHMENSEDMDVRNKWKKVLDKEGRIKTSLTENHIPQQNDT